MALTIFDTDPDAKPQQREKKTYAEIMFDFRSGMQVPKASGKGTQPVSLSKWRVLTGSPDVAQGISELMGGTAEEFDPSKEKNLAIMTDQPSVEIVVAGVSAVEDKMILWGPQGPIHECDGSNFLSPADRAGEPCGCPTTLKARKAAGSKGTGPKPSINVTFRLAGAGYDLGFGQLRAQAWSLAEVIHEVKNDLAAIDGEALCRLELEHVEYMSDKYGEVSYYWPKITVLGSYNDAIADERN